MDTSSALGNILNIKKSNLLSIYGEADVVKSEENDLEKSGEGSKGGKVIGHTTSGKAIYEDHNHKSHKKFDEKDHKEAAVEHSKLSDKEKTIEGLKKHSTAAVHHWEQHYAKGGDHKDSRDGKAYEKDDKK